MEGAISSPPNTRIAVVTGGNKGIGFEVCRQLASDGVTVVLTARDEMRGTAAVDKLKGLGQFKVVFHQLDVSDASSIAGLANFLKTRFGKLDILVNNASVGGAEYVQPLDTDEEKVINNDDVRHELNDIDSLTEKRLDELLEKFLMDFEAGALEAHGWPTGLAAYKMAKVAMNAFSRILAKRHPELCVNCAHPVAILPAPIALTPAAPLPPPEERRSARLAAKPFMSALDKAIKVLHGKMGIIDPELPLEQARRLYIDSYKTAVPGNTIQALVSLFKLNMPAITAADEALIAMAGPGGSDLTPTAALESTS